MVRDKKAVSPVISTVLLILIVIILAVIILLWSRGFIKEKILKFDKPIEEDCKEVSLKTFINPDNSGFGFTNNGNVPIYAIQLKISDKTSGSSEIRRIDDNVDSGVSKMIDEPYYESDGITPLYKEVKIIPVLLGKTSAGAVKEYSCPDSGGIVV
jgi:flagellin-like protein